MFAKKSLPLAGLLFFLWATTDPAFWTVIALCAKENNVFLTITCCGIWMIIGQLPLYVLTVACIFDAHEKVIYKVNDFLDKNNRREKFKKILYVILSLLILGIGIYFVIEPLYYLIKGAWL